MVPTVEVDCPQCGRTCAASEKCCSLCGHLFARPDAAAVSAPAPRAFTVPSGEPVVLEEPRIMGLSEGWFFLLLGLVTAPVFALTPMLGYMGWFLSSLAHEMGHSAVAWFFGCPAFPAIRIDGHAAAFHGSQKLLFVVLIAGALAWGAWQLEPKRVRVPAVVIALGVYLGFALTPAREILHLTGGHGGELVFAAICLWRAHTGGFTAHVVERALYGTLGWFLLGDNLILTTKLVFSAAARREYAGNGSFGLTNDYIRLAEDVLGTSLPVVAFLMTVVALGVLPLALFLSRLGGKRASG